LDFGPEPGADFASSSFSARPRTLVREAQADYRDDHDRTEESGPHQRRQSAWLPGLAKPAGPTRPRQQKLRDGCRGKAGASEEAGE